MQKTILITGASSGFGKLTAKTLLENNHQVIATMRDIQGKNKSNAEELAKLGAKIIELDVTDDASVELAIKNAANEVSKIDVVINNAGVGVMGYQEAFTVDDFKRVFEINVFGVQRVIRAILPHFRKNKSGTIINISSLLGRITIPFYGPYNATKWAVEAMSENYRVELSQLGIDVCIVEPGGFPTNFMERLIKPSDNSRNQYYSEISPTPEVSFSNFEHALAANPAQNPQNVANAIFDLVQNDIGQ